MTDYLVIYEQGEASWGAYAPDLPGCVAVGETRDEVELLMREAVGAHLALLTEKPAPASFPGIIAA
jgi:predicted RNase H-like HicB family nuclease